MSAAEREFRVGDHSYRAGLISTFDQLHVATEWRETLMSLSFMKRDRPPEMTDRTYSDSVAVVVAGGLQRVDPASRERITLLLMSAVKRKGDGATGWFPLVVGGQQAFQDVRLPQLIPILYNVIDHNGLLDFFSVGPSDSRDGPEASSGPDSPTEKTGSSHPSSRGAVGSRAS